LDIKGLTTLFSIVSNYCMIVNNDLENMSKEAIMV
jgi:hypothetical protein